MYILAMVTPTSRKIRSRCWRGRNIGGGFRNILNLFHRIKRLPMTKSAQSFGRLSSTI